MDKFSKKVFKYLLDKKDHAFLFTSDLPDGFSDKRSFLDALGYIFRLGYADYIKNQNGLHLGIRLTHEGIHKRELDHQEFWRNFFTKYIPGVISGIVISVAANLLTSYGQQLLSLLSQ